MLVLHDKDTLLHETVELLGSKLIPALESVDRIKAIVAGLERSHKHQLKIISASEDDKNIALELAKTTHQQSYLEHIQTVFRQWLDAGLVKEDDSVLPECFRLHSATSKVKPPKDIFARAGFYAFDMSSGICRNSWISIIASANLAVQAAHYLLQTSTLPQYNVLALCRPPGHHCTPSQAGGYCYINNIALAVTALRHFSPVKRVRRTSNPHFSASSTLKFAILDIDFHHGNGTQEMFWNDSDVLYVSIHGEDEFPYYTGGADETGPPSPDPAHGTNFNLPLAPGSTLEQYMEKLNQGLRAIKQFDADYLLVSLGFDTFHLDPLGKFEIKTEDYAEIARSIRSAITVPAVMLLEGGYVIDRLGENLLSFLEGWEGATSDKETWKGKRTEQF